MKGSLTATSSISSLSRATLATKRPILPKPNFSLQNNRTDIIFQPGKSQSLQIIDRKRKIEALPLIPILIFPPMVFKRDSLTNTRKRRAEQENRAEMRKDSRTKRNHRF
eukprot:TRINITY_DN5648_c1_g1_i1.p1 TRINITY_DN5648_c1_g1~~TRINITY_DN5648_c1_g1_i1.p1  ORF type:complete len:109 (-),score=10.67 TRINITY_DN5648_c1_g1_i1:37-363(-)